MKNLFKKSKKSGLPGYMAKRQAKIWGLSAFLLLIIGIVLFSTGDAGVCSVGAILASAPIVALTIPDGDWTEEEKKVLSGLAKHFSGQLNKYFEDALSKEDMLNDIEKKLSEKGFGKDRIDKFEKAIKQIEDDVKNTQRQMDKEDKTLASSIVKEIKELTGAGSVSELKAYLRQNPDIAGKTIVIKDAVMTADMTGTIGTTNMDRTVGWQYVRRLAILPYLRTVSERSDKGIFGYTEGSYTSNAGYAGEASNNVQGDEAAAIERTRKYAKISAWQTVSTETYEDLSDFAEGLVRQLRYGALLFADQQAYNGDGNDATQPQHLYGILGAATEFDAATYAASVEKANIADLFAAVENQINNTVGAPFVANIAFMNNIDLFKMRRLKDDTGQPIVNRDLFGNPTVGNVRIVTNSMFASNTLMMVDSECIELRIKRDMELKMGQILANDVKNDTQSAILFARLQILIKERDKKGVVKVGDIESAIDDINIV